MKQYYKIGEISALYNIGADSLRYYEEIGIISPKRASNGYRMYNLVDVWKLSVIKDLRKLDLSMQTIKEYLNNRTVESTLQMLQKEISLIEGQMEELQCLRSSISNRIQSIEQSKAAPIDRFVCKEIPPRFAVMLMHDCSRDEEVDFLIQSLRKEDEGELYVWGNSSIGVTITLENIDKGITAQYNRVFMLTNNPLKQQFTLPAGKYLSYFYEGAYHRSRTVMQEMLEYAAANHLRPGGECIELYHIDIHETALHKEFLTEIQLPVEPIAAKSIAK